MWKRLTFIVLVLIQIMLLFPSCQTIRKGESIAYFSTSDYVPYLLSVNFFIILRDDGINGKYGESLNRFLIDHIRSRIEIFLLEYSFTVDSITLLSKIEDGSLSKLLIDYINGLPRLEGSEVESLKILILDPS